MRLLHFLYTEGYSGAEKHVAQMLPGLQAKGVDVQLLILCPPHAEENMHPMTAPLRTAGIRVTVMHTRSSLSPFALLKVSRFIKRQGITAVHAHMLRSDLIISLIKKFLQPELYFISTRHGYNATIAVRHAQPGFQVKKDMIWRITAFTLKQADSNIAVSHYTKKLFEDLQFQTDHFEVIHHGINEPSPVFEEGIEYRKSAFQLIMVGRLEPLKGQRYVIKAMPAIVKEIREASLVIVGNGSDEASLKALTAAFGMEAHVFFEGFRKDAPAFIEASDIVVNPTLADAFGLVFLEGMAAGKPIIAFDVPAGNEILSNGVTGILTEPANTKAIEEAVIALYRDPAFASALARQARETYRSQYSTEVMAEHTFQFYKTISSDGNQRSASI